MFRDIHDIIVEDNKRSGIKPSSTRNSSSPTRDLPGSVRQPSPRPLSMPAASSFQQGNGFSDEKDSHEYLRDSMAPTSPIKTPRQLSSVLPVSNETRILPNLNSGQAEVLAERFAQLRVPPINQTVPLQAKYSGIIDIPSPESYDSEPPINSFTSRFKSQFSPDFQDSRPSGARAMPAPPQNVPQPPPKIPIDTRSTESFPRAPSPAYNPARNLQSPPSITPPRNTARSSAMNGVRSSHPTTTAIVDPSGDDIDPSRQADTSSYFKAAKHIFAELPNSTAIHVDELYDRLQTSHVLLIDVRSRDEFDQGHIFAKNIICVEPLILIPGASADDLEERLAVSPEAEQLLFERRNEFDLVVYYDQGTTSNQFLAGPLNHASSPALRTLHDTLYEFNYYKELRRPPAFLLGGLDSWIDKVGPQALQTSRTLALIGATRPRRSARVSRPALGRMPTANFNSSLEVRRRRLLGHNPLDADEERAWLEKARKEEVDSADYQQSQSDGDTDSVSSHPDEPISPLIHSYEDFLRKFPEPQVIQQSMVGSGPGPPSRPAPILPPVPSRPAPAVPRPSYRGVSEGESQLSPASRQSSSARPPLYTSKSIAHYLKLPRTGLINFSVTCYMNATIQCLLATIPLSQFFLDNRWRDFTQKNWKGSNGVMPEIYANLIRSLWKNDVQAVRPTSLRNFCARLNREWGIDRQQDAKEFFDFLIDCLHEDLNVHWDRSPLRQLTTEEELTRERMPMNRVSKTEWERYTHRESSFIADLFAGQHASLLRCTTCRNTSTTYEAFYSISVEIPRGGQGDIRECLRSYCQEEMLSGDEVWKCPHCRCEREATKRITLTRLPKVLVIHFKRFSASKTETARKIHTPIEFPLYGLNMEPYMAPTQMEPTKDGSVDPATTPPFQYDAYAVMRHLGQTGNGGHYISLVRDAARGCWRKFDDERATDFDPSKLRPEQRLQNEQAYIIFYGRSAAR